MSIRLVYLMVQELLIRQVRWVEAEPAERPQDRSEPMPRIHSRDGFSPVYDHQGEDNDWDEEGFSAVPAEITEHKRAEEGEGG